MKVVSAPAAPTNAIVRAIAWSLSPYSRLLNDEPTRPPASTIGASGPTEKPKVLVSSESSSTRGRNGQTPGSDVVVDVWLPMKSGIVTLGRFDASTPIRAPPIVQIAGTTSDGFAVGSSPGSVRQVAVTAPLSARAYTVPMMDVSTPRATAAAIGGHAPARLSSGPSRPRSGAAPAALGDSCIAGGRARSGDMGGVRPLVPTRNASASVRRMSILISNNDADAASTARASWVVSVVVPARRRRSTVVQCIPAWALLTGGIGKAKI